MAETKKTPKDMNQDPQLCWALTVAVMPRAMFFSHTLVTKIRSPRRGSAYSAV